MKKKTLFASALAMIGAAAMVPATTTTQANAETTVNQKADSGNGSGSTSSQPATTQQQKAPVRLVDDSGKAPGLPMGFYRSSPYHKWCNMPKANTCNKIKRSRNTKRKHRRA